MWIDPNSLLRRIDERGEFSDKTRRAMIEGMRKHMDAMPPGAPRGELLRAMEHMETDAPGDFTTEMTTLWRPHVDIEIDASVFEFTPPAD
jgi:hypothetical protein